MPSDFPLRSKITVALAAALSLWGVGEYFSYEAEYQKQSHDPYAIAAQENRLAGVRTVIPENATLGYLTDATPNTMTAWAIFSGAQYSLAPRILVENTSQDWVLGNFTRPADFAAIGRSHGLRVERDLSNGVILFRKENAK
jgi:hypothetical protein